MVFIKSVLSSIRVIALVCFALSSANAAEPVYEDKLLGDMGGLRSSLANHGIDFTLDYTATAWNVSNVSNEGSNYLDNLDIVFDVDGAKAYNIEGNKLHVYFLSNAGGAPNEKRIGSIEAIDNMEVGTNSFKLYEFWTEQSFFNDKASILLGLYDLNSEFYSTDMSGNFIKPTMGINQDLAQTGQNGPSIFPTTSLAARLKIEPLESTYVQAAVFDGVSGNPDHPRGTHIDFEDNDGLLLIAEVGYTPNATDDGAFNKFALGAWHYTEKFDDLVDTDILGNPLKQDSEGLYAMASYQFYRDEKEGRTLGAFWRGGVANGDVAQSSWSYTAGIVANGWVPTRSEGEIGLGVSQSHNSDAYMRSVVAAASMADRNETGWELYYKDMLCKSVYIQPDIQYIVNPGTAPEADNALAIGLRVGISF